MKLFSSGHQSGNKKKTRQGNGQHSKPKGDKKQYRGQGK